MSGQNPTNPSSAVIRNFLEECTLWIQKGAVTALYEEVRIPSAQWSFILHGHSVTVTETRVTIQNKKEGNVVVLDTASCPRRLRQKLFRLCQAQHSHSVAEGKRIIRDLVRRKDKEQISELAKSLQPPEASW